ncbi:MAG: choice-of-anchor D domain-containing protein, partial [Ignavibacteriaceae bacterium]
MLRKHYFIISLLFTIILSGLGFGQNVLQLDPNQELVAQIIADTTANNGILPDRVYELVGGANYLCTQIFYVADKDVLRLRSSDNQKAKIYLYPTGTGTSPQNPPGYFIRLRGGDLYMKNIALTGYFEPIDTNFNNIQGGMLRTDNEGSNIILDSCIFSNINGQVIRCEASTGTIRITNSILTNLGALSTSNFGAGKGIDLRAVSCDSLILVNNTWTNYQDRVVRHYNFSNPLEGTGNIRYTLIDHNTMYNGMGFHGLLSLGNVGKTVIITNNLFKDAFALGEDSTDATRAAEWANTGEFYPNGLSRITWIFSAPNDTTQWVINHNYYAISDSGQAFFDDFTGYPIVEGSPLSWHINSRLGADSVNAFTKIDDPALANTQKLMTNLMRWYEDTTHTGNPPEATAGNRSKNTPNSWWQWPEDDMDRQPLSFWINDEDASYSMSSAAYTGAQQGYPAGDLNWFPDKHAQWSTGASNLPEISLSTSSVDFGTVVTGSAKTDSILVSNSGAVTLNISSISSDNSNFAFSPSTLDVPSSGSAYLKITFTPSDTNAQNGTITLTHNADNSPSTITVNG